MAPVSDRPMTRTD